MDRNELKELLKVLDNRRETEERRREERYTMLIEDGRVGNDGAKPYRNTKSAPKAQVMKMMVVFEWLATTASWPWEFWDPA
ncbi:UNVERIFIED_CONTAM: hypothetical protein FKN15_046573 [Acipenser sinensis]